MRQRGFAPVARFFAFPFDLPETISGKMTNPPFRHPTQFYDGSAAQIYTF
jgi:hypothetical protein